MSRSIALCLLALMLASPAAMACRSHGDACYKNCSQLNSKVARFFCYLGK